MSREDVAAVVVHESGGVQTAGPLPPYNPPVTSADCNLHNASLVRALRSVSERDDCAQICHAAADEIERLAEGWLPIENAPRVADDTFYLLGFFGSRPDGFPSAQVGLWDGEQWSGDWCLVDEGSFDPGYQACQPTHFMLLPKPPVRAP